MRKYRALISNYHDNRNLLHCYYASSNSNLLDHPRLSATLISFVLLTLTVMDLYSVIYISSALHTNYYLQLANKNKQTNEIKNPPERRASYCQLEVATALTD